MKHVIIFFMTMLLCISCIIPGFAEVPQGSLRYSPKDTEKVIKQKTDYNNAYWMFFSLLASSAAYNPEGGASATYLRNHGWKFVPRKLADGKTTVHCITAKGTEADGTPLYVIAFRGSADKKDWAADFRTERVVYGGNTLDESEKIADGDAKSISPKADTKNLPKVHKGFNAYADLALRVLLNEESRDFLAQFRKDSRAKLLLTGHSLGGAVATLVGERLIDFGLDPQRIQVITFGAPAVANKNFAQLYGNRMNLIRVTNSEDPIPLALQAVLRKYRQFGNEVKFRIPRTVNNMNHFLTLYLDFGLQYYYKELDAAVKKGLLTDWPDAKWTDPEKPMVLLYVKRNDAARVKEVMALLERFMLNEYKALLPNFRVERSGADPYEALRKSGADYLLLLEFEAEPDRESSNWFLTLDQTLSDRDGNVLAVGSAARQTSPLAGNILAAMEAVHVERRELILQLPWLAEGGQVK